MGLAASQARLLSITQRLSDNELRAQLVNNQKMRLNSESSRVSENYINALNKTNLVFANYDSEDKAQNVPLTFNNLTAFNKFNNQYNLTNTAGNVLISEDDAAKYQAANGDLEKFLEQYGLVYTTSYWDTIGNQLHNCEDFYSNPNKTGYIEQYKRDKSGNFVLDDNGNKIIEATGPRYDETTKKWTSDIDGYYAFFSAEQLKKMYEGTPTVTDNAGNITNEGIASYAETIKTWQYTDFVKAYDTWNEELAQYRKTENQRNAAIENAALQIASNTTGSIISSDKIYLDTNNGTLSTDQTFTCNNFDPAITVDLNSYLPELKDLDISYNETTRTWEKEQDFNDILKGTITTVKTTDAANAHNALYYETDGNLYVQILEQGEEDNLTVSYWLNTSDKKVYKLKDGSLSEMDKTTTGDLQNEKGDKIGTVSTTLTPNFSNNIADWKTTVTNTYTDGRNPSTTTEEDLTYVVYPSSDATSIPTKTPIDLTNHKTMITNLAANYVNKNGLKEIIKTQITAGNQLKGENLTLTEEELKLINNPPNTDEIIENLITQLNELLGTNVAKDNPNEMDEILISLTSGTNLTQDENSNYTLVHGEPNKSIAIPKTSIALINALVCDTLMDYFGEPIYGYMKQNASGEWITAEEEARWYTNLFEKIQSCGYQVLAKGLANSTDWMQFAFENGLVIMEQINSEQNWQPIAYTSCSDIIEQSDTKAATLAEAEYNKAMRQIESKDEMLDLELKNIDTEHTSLQTEYESVKKAMTGNIERTFQMYG